MRTRRGGLALVLALACSMGALSPSPTPALGQLSDRNAVVRVLQESHDFRARARAALALGASADPTMAAPLATALRDENAAVRAAAAEGLARVGGATQLGALRGLARDPERQVRDAAGRAVTAIEARIRAPAPTPAGPASPRPPASTPRTDVRLRTTSLRRTCASDGWAYPLRFSIDPSTTT